MVRILTIADISEERTAKNGNKFVILFFEPFEDAEGVINIPEPKAIFDEKVIKMVGIGKKVRL
jgi:hypothetical protein